MSAAGQIGRNPRRDVLQENLEDGDLVALSGVMEEVRRLLGSDSVPPLEQIGDFDAAIAALETGWQGVRSALLEGERGVDRLMATPVGSLADRLVVTERAVHKASARSRLNAFSRVREVTAELESATSVDGLMTVGAQAACQLGFDRSLLSRIDGNSWVTERMHLGEDSEWAEEIVAAGRRNPVALWRGLPEDDLLRRQVPIIVAPVSRQKHVHRAVVEASATRSYVAAPVVVSGDTIGFLHADRFFHRGDVDEVDVELIGLFAQAFSFVLQRVIISDELSMLRESVARIGDGLRAAAGSPASTGVPDLSTIGTSAPLAAPQSLHIRIVPDARESGPLTRREAEVLGLMAKGATNQRIARMLVISEWTAKSHVKNIMRKLGAENRAEAVSLWYQSKTD